MNGEQARTIIRSIQRRRSEYVEANGEPPTFVIMDPENYLILRQYCHVPDDGPDRFMGMVIVVVDVPEMLAVAGKPWIDALRDYGAHARS